MFGRSQRIRMPPAPSPVRIVVVIQKPAFEIDRVDDQRIALPAAHRVSVVGRLDSGSVRTSVEGNNSRHSLKLMNHNQILRGLKDLDWIELWHPGWKSCRHAKSTRFID